MNRRLLLLRHAKSDWDTDAPGDFERPLAKRGRRDAPRIGQWLSERPELHPGLVIASPAERARETVVLVLETIGGDKVDITWDQRIYGASPGELIEVLKEVPAETGSVMLLGHNPGLEQLLGILCPDVEMSAGGKLFPTGTLAYIQLAGHFADLEPGTGVLEKIIRPRELD
ncbi:MAG: histidine phosphatase family protein [Gammaproteobacteria bacterium]|nr:MAG: histidine phosphatase family protein [Gammaproteobacteria bacterium]